MRSRTCLVGFSLLALATGCLSDGGAPEIYLSPLEPTTEDNLEFNASNPEELSIRWYQGDVYRADIEGLVVSFEETSKGEAWHVVAGTDSGGGWNLAEAAVTILNSAPEVTGIELSSAIVLSSEDLVAIPVATDPDEADLEKLSFTFQWQKEGSEAVIVEHRLSSSETAAGDVWTVTVTPYDQEDYGAPFSLNFNVENEPPEMVAVSLTPDPAYEASTLVAEGSAHDPNTDAITLSYAWSINGLELISGEASTLDGEFFDKGDVVQVSVTPYDGFVDGEAMSADAVTISNSLPAIVSVEISPDPVNAASDLFCVPSGWVDDDGDEEDYLYSWEVNGVVRGTDETLEHGSFSKNQSIQCTCTPFDGLDQGTPLSSLISVVENSPPTLLDVTLDPAAPSVSDTVTAVLGTPFDADGDAISYTYAWTVNGTSAGTDDPTLSLAGFSRGQVVQVVVTPGDGQDDGTPVSSSQITLVNSPPSLTEVVLTPNVVASDGVITATVNGATDPDAGDSVNIQYNWYKNGVLYTGASGDTLDATHFNSADGVSVEATPTDGYDSGDPVGSNVVTVNSPPTVSGVRIDPNPANVSDTITCFHDTPADVDLGDTVSLTYDWTVNSIPYGNQGATLTQAASRGSVVSCTVTPSDSLESGAAVSSGDLTLSNSPPTVDTVNLYGASGSGLQTNDVLTVNAVPSDADSDSPLILQYHWYVANAHQAAETTSSLDGATAFEKGEEVYVQVSAFDGIDYGSPYTTLPLTVVNTPPGAATVSMSTATPKEGQDDIVCQVDTPAPDDDSSDTLTYSFAWTVDGGPHSATPGQTTHAGDTILSSDLVRSQVWECTVTPSDGTDTGPTSQATATVIPPFTGWPVPDWYVANADVIFEAEGDYEYLEWISGAGDVDNDGLADVLVSMVTNEYYGASKVYLLRSSSGNLAANATALNLGDRDHDNQLDATEDKADMAFLAEVTNDQGNHWDPDLAISSIAPLGDLDGDGFDEILMGSPYADGPAGQNSGKAYLFWGSDLATGTGDFDLSNADHIYYGATAEQRVGSAVASAGDVNGDTYGDFLISAENAATSETGEVYLFLGDGTQTRETDYALGAADYTFRGAPDFISNGYSYYPRYAGREVEGAGDLDGDGLADILIAEEVSYYGLVWVFYGDTIASLVPGLHSTSDGDHLLVGEEYSDEGCSLTRVGDVDNDGYDDLLIGAPGWVSSHGQTSHDWGVAYLVLSGTLATLNSATDPNLDLADADYRFEGFVSSQRAGGDLAGAGDVDADGYADFLIGAGAQSNSWVMDGAYLFLGQNLGASGTYLISDADYKFTGEYQGSHVGRAVAGPGDINGDGLDDLLTTNVSHNQSESRAYILLSP